MVEHCLLRLIPHHSIFIYCLPFATLTVMSERVTLRFHLINCLSLWCSTALIFLLIFVLPFDHLTMLAWGLKV